MRNNTKLGILCHHALGGSSKIAYMIANLLSFNSNYEIHIFCLAKPWFLDNLQKSCTLHYLQDTSAPLFNLETDYPERSYDDFIKMVLAQILKHKITVLHGHYATPFAKILNNIRGLLKEIYETDLKTILTLHGTDITNKATPVKHKALQQELEKINVITAVSDYLAKSAKLQYKLPQPIQVIYNFTDIKSGFTFERPVNFDDTDKPRVITHISNFRPIKQTPQIIEIFKQISKTENVLLFMVGDGPERHQSEELVVKYNLQNIVKFFGFQLNIEKFIHQSDILLVASSSEGFSLAALEALSCGIPVVATSIGGISEVVEDGINGLLYAANDIDDGATKILNLLRNKEIYEQMHKNALNITAKFSLEKQINHYVSLYQTQD